jgi:hypothetical protein
MPNICPNFILVLKPLQLHNYSLGKCAGFGESEVRRNLGWRMKTLGIPEEFIERS